MLEKGELMKIVWILITLFITYSAQAADRNSAYQKFESEKLECFKNYGTVPKSDDRCNEEEKQIY